MLLMSQYKIQTYSGQLVDYLNPNPDTIKIEDIAKALSLEVRFGGQCRFHYSVGQHSILACGLAPKSLKLEALLHDAEEAYIKDMPSPLAAAIGRGVVNQYRWVKTGMQKVIAEKFKLSWTNEAHRIIKEIDLRLAITECDALFMNPQPLFGDYHPQPYVNLPIFPEAMINIEKRFLEMFNLYRRNDGTEKVDIVNLREDRN
jgi:uncharacterized protein